MSNKLKFSALGLSYKENPCIKENTEVLDKIYRIIRSLDNWNDSTVRLEENNQVEIYVDKVNIIYMGTIEYLYSKDSVLEGDYRWREVL